MTKKTVLILGMGHSQLDLAQAAREYGAQVFACAHRVEGPALPYLDGHAKLDIRDIDGIASYAQAINADVIFTLGLEMALEPIAKVSERLGLPTFFESETLANLKNKVVWRQKLAGIEGNLAYAQGYSWEDFESWNEYPAVLKPSDGSGQRGVIRVESFDEVKARFMSSRKYSRSGLMILEEFASGDEISVNSFVEDGELKFALISDRLSHEDLPGGIIREHHIPSKYDYAPLANRIIEMVRKVNYIMGFNRGHVYFQIKVDKEKLSLIEFTPRFDGCHMWRLIRTVTGLDLLQVSLENLLEGSSSTLAAYKPVDLHSNPYQLCFNSDRPGIVVDYANYTVPNEAVYNCWYYEQGDRIKSVTNILEKVGYYIARPQVG